MTICFFSSQETIEFEYDPTSAISFYYLNPTTGEITLRQSLLGATQTLDVIRVRACDRRLVNRLCSAYADVRITILRNLASPVFLSQPYTISNLDRNTLAGTFIYQTTGSDADLRVSVWEFSDAN